MTIPFRTSKPTQETFVPTVPLDASAMRLYGLSDQPENHWPLSTPRRLKRTWWRHLLQGLL